MASMPVPMFFFMCTSVAALMLAKEPSALLVAPRGPFARPHVDEVDQQAVCTDAFDACWDRASWKATPMCSGVPGTWENMLFSKGMDTMCNKDALALLGGTSCSKARSLCDARSALSRSGCRVAKELTDIHHKDTIFLRAYTGTYFDVRDGSVKARWKDHGLLQTLSIEKNGAGQIQSGDSVFVKSYDGQFLDSSGSSVWAQLAHNSTRQAFIVEKVGTGAVRSGDAIFLKNPEGKFVDVNGDNVTALEEKGGNRQVFFIEKELQWKEATAVNFGRNCDMPIPSSNEVQSGDVAFFRASNGKLLDVADDGVHARWADFGEFQKMTIETSRFGSIHSGDRVFIKSSHEGSHIDVKNNSVRARWNGHGHLQRLQITAKGEGVIRYGDSISLTSEEGKNIAVVNDTVVAVSNSTWNSSSGSHLFSIQRGKWKETLGFVHIPKNGGTALEDVAWAHDIRWGRWLMFDMFHVEGNAWCSTHHVPPAFLSSDAQQKYLNMENLCVTRHPYSRALSEYSYELSQTMENPNREKTDAQLYKFAPCTAEALNFYLQTQLHLVLNGPGKWVNDCHFVPQSEYIWDKERQWCAHILRMEDMPQAFNDLMQSKGYPMRLSEDAHNKTNSHSQLCPNLTADSLDNTTKSLLDLAYAVDFRRLGYSK